MNKIIVSFLKDRLENHNPAIGKELERCSVQKCILRLHNKHHAFLTLSKLVLHRRKCTWIAHLFFVACAFENNQQYC